VQHRITVDCHPALGINRPEKELQKFQALHPMFSYQVEEVPESVAKALKAAKEIVIVGLGGSVLPLRALLDLHPRSQDLLYLDSVDPRRVEKVFNQLRDPLFCVVSKSGETLEIQILLAEILKRFGDNKILAVTDSKSGKLRALATEKKWLSLSIPSELGGRFTHFTVFHRALLENWGVSFEALLMRARSQIEELKNSSQSLELLKRMLFNEGVSHHIFWHYGQAREGMALWMQQVLAESLGKTRADGQRFGILPTVLEGPQAQHFVLQLLMDGPQNSALWFLEPSAVQKTESALERGLWVLAESTKQSFLERVPNPKLSQSVISSSLTSIEDAVDLIVLIQAFIEYLADDFNIPAFDQPGVERGKTIARELWSKSKK